MMRVGTKDKYSGEVSLEHFKNPNFSKKTYLKGVMEVVKNGLEKLKVEKDEPLHICTGYILSQIREALINEGYRVIPSRIMGKTQKFAEDEFIKSLVKLGIGNEKEIRNMRSFDGFLKWVHQGINTREIYVKSGWKSWTRLRKEGKMNES